MDLSLSFPEKFFIIFSVFAIFTLLAGSIGAELNNLYKNEFGQLEKIPNITKNTVLLLSFIAFTICIIILFA